MLAISCKKCGATAAAATTAGVGTLALPGCRCCLADHDHNDFGCRPVNIEAPPGFQRASMLSGGGDPASPDMTLPA